MEHDAAHSGQLVPKKFVILSAPFGGGGEVASKSFLRWAAERDMQQYNEPRRELHLEQSSSLDIDHISMPDLTLPFFVCCGVVAAKRLRTYIQEFCTDENVSQTYILQSGGITQLESETGNCGLPESRRIEMIASYPEELDYVTKEVEDCNFIIHRPRALRDLKSQMYRSASGRGQPVSKDFLNSHIHKARTYILDTYGITPTLAEE